MERTPSEAADDIFVVYRALMYVFACCPSNEHSDTNKKQRTKQMLCCTLRNITVYFYFIIMWKEGEANDKLTTPFP